MLAFIPYYMGKYLIKKYKEGNFLNTEVDMLARYVFKALKK